MIKRHSRVTEFPPSRQLDRLGDLAARAESNDVARAQIAFLEDACDIISYLQLITRFGVN